MIVMFSAAIGTSLLLFASTTAIASEPVNAPVTKNIPITKVGTVQSLVVSSKGSQNACGVFTGVMKMPYGYVYMGLGENTIIIWRNFSNNERDVKAKSLGIIIGNAYLWESNTSYKFVRKVDLKKSDKELCVEFGVSTKAHKYILANPGSE